MASSSSREIPFADDEIIEARSVAFDSNVELPDLGAGIDLLGFLIADIEPGAGGVKATLLGLWKNIGQIRIVRAKKNVYSISVGSEKLARRLIDGSPWNVKGYCFSLRNWPLHLSIDDIEPTRSIYWIQAHGIPREMLSVSNGRKLGALLGSLLEVEDPAKVGNRGFLRLRIDIDASKPLSTSCLLPCHSTTKKIRLQYEHLKSFCFRCGRLGHMISVCNYQVNPILIRMGVVYDLSLVADVVQKSVHTLPHYPIEFPVTTTHSLRHLPRRVSSEVETQHGHGIGPSTQCMTTLKLDRDKYSSPHIVPDMQSTSLVQSSGVHKHGERQGLWHPDTNGTIFRNGCVIVALKGLNTDSPQWADPNVIPPWAYNNRAEFERVNHFFPVPCFFNESIMATLPSSSVRIEEVVPPVMPSTSFIEKPAIIQLNQPFSQRKRKAKRAASVVTLTEVSQNKKVRLPISPGLRLSNSRGGRRGSRGVMRGRGRSTGQSKVLGDDQSAASQHDRSSFLINFGGSNCDETDCNHVCLAKGMEDLTHLQGCGGWPNSAARGQ